MTKTAYTCQCAWCGRTFLRPMPHRCNTGFRKRHLQFITTTKTKTKTKTKKSMTREALEIANELNHKIDLCTSALERPVTGIRYDGGNINLPKEVNEDIRHVIEKWSEKYRKQFAKL